MEAPGFWDDPDYSNQKMKELKNLKDVVELCDGLSQQYEDIQTLIEMGYEAEDPDMVPEVREELDEFIRQFEGEVPGAKPEECGNYLDMNLGMAKYLADKYLDGVLNKITKDRLVYPA